MVIDAAGMNLSALASMRTRKEETIALRQAVKDCYCGLGPACCHWSEMTNAERAACACDKRASAEARWKNGTVG
jgi:hypothetical protein